MPKTLDPIPADAQIVAKGGIITNFFRLRWQSLMSLSAFVPTLAIVRSDLVQAASVVATAAYTTKNSGQYRISWYVRKTVIDGVASTLQMTIGWAESSLALTSVGASLATDTILSTQSGSVTVEADANVDLTFAIAYTSNTPGKMKFRYTIIVEQMA